MKADRVRWIAAVGAILAIVPLASSPIQGQEPSDAGIEPGSADILGVVEDRVTGLPLSGVAVRLVRVSGGGSRLLLSSDGGHFEFTSVRAEEYRIEVSLIGYRSVELDLAVESGAQTDLSVAMVPVAVELEPVVVTSRRQSYLQRVGFLDRRERGLGRFLGREEIADRDPYNVSDLFRGIPGFRVRPGPGATSRVVGRRGCAPTLYVDGVRLGSASAIDEVLLPHHLEAIEAYPGLQTPAQFRAGACGAVVAWTRAPDRGEGSGSRWRWVIGGAGFLGIVLLGMN